MSCRVENRAEDEAEEVKNPLHSQCPLSALWCGDQALEPGGLRVCQSLHRAPARDAAMRRQLLPPLLFPVPDCAPAMQGTQGSMPNCCYRCSSEVLDSPPPFSCHVIRGECLAWQYKHLLFWSKIRNGRAKWRFWL